VAYFYLVASLPLLALDRETPWSPEEFYYYCENLLSPSDLRDLRRIVDGELEGLVHPAARHWACVETQLRNALARARAARAGLSVSPPQRPYDGFDMRAERAAAEAMGAADPLERELILDKHRWYLLEEMAGLDSFGAAAVFSYALRLRIAQKWQNLTEEKGRAVVEGIVEDNVAGNVA
jgi:hypothetical protein